MDDWGILMIFYVLFRRKKGVACICLGTHTSEGADRVKGRWRWGGGRWEVWGREEGEERWEDGEEGEGGGNRGAGGWRGEKKGEGGKSGNFCARGARAAPRRETRGGRGEVRGREGGEANPLVHPVTSSQPLLQNNFIPGRCFRNLLRLKHSWPCTCVLALLPDPSRARSTCVNEGTLLKKDFFFRMEGYSNKFNA